MFTPLGGSENALVDGEIAYSTETAVFLFGALAGWFYSEDDRHIAHKILNKAFDLADDAEVLDVHFLYQQAIETYLRDRKKPEFRRAAVDACWKQIELAPRAAVAFKLESPAGPLPSPSWI